MTTVEHDDIQQFRVGKSVHMHNNSLYRGLLWLIRSKTPWGGIDHTSPSAAVPSRFRQRAFMCEGTGSSISAHTTHSAIRLIVVCFGQFLRRKEGAGTIFCGGQLAGSVGRTLRTMSTESAPKTIGSIPNQWKTTINDTIIDCAQG